MEPSTFTSTHLQLGDVCRLLAQAGFEVGAPVALRRTMLDTFDGRLHAAGLRLEMRETDRRELVLSGDGPVVARLPVDRLPTFATDFPGGPFRSRLAPLLDVRTLLPILRASGRRVSAMRRDGSGKVRVRVELHGAVTVDGTAIPLPASLVEVDELEGYPSAARRARRVLESFGLEPRDGDVVDLLAEAVGVDLRGYRGSPTVALRREEPAIDAFRKVLANLADAVDANWAGTVDDVDTEFLHELRVAVRRTRSVLAQARRVLPDEVRSRYREGFGWLGTATSPARDLDVYVIEWAGYVEPLGPVVAAALRPVVDHIARLKQGEHAVLAEALRSARYRELMTAWRAWLEAVQPGDGRAREALRPIGRVAGKRIAAAQAQVLTRGRAIEPGTPAEELHELRKDAKRLRYAIECFGGVLAPTPRKAFVQRLKALQDNLGEHQDTEVHSTQLRVFSRDLFDAGSTPPETLVAMGQLAERFELRRQAARDEFAQRFAAYDTKETARTMEALLDEAAGR